VRIPPGVVSGTRVSVQALSLGAAAPALTAAITIDVL